MRIGRRIVKALFWGLTLSLSIAGGALWFAYWYMTDSDTAARSSGSAPSIIFLARALNRGEFVFDRCLARLCSISFIWCRESMGRRSRCCAFRI